MNTTRPMSIVRGQRVRLIETIDLFPDGLVREGTGMIVYASHVCVFVSLDETVPCLEPWDNHLMWTNDDCRDFADARVKCARDVELI